MKLPPQELKALINYYKDKNKIELMQILLINLDFEQQDVEQLISLCLENELFTALLYICGKGNDPDQFLAPLIRYFYLGQI